MTDAGTKAADGFGLLAAEPEPLSLQATTPKAKLVTKTHFKTLIFIAIVLEFRFVKNITRQRGIDKLMQRSEILPAG